ncbi:hypothetical protein JL193_12585 [Polaribacter batillariae]|uniref:DUF5723 domain-containing protein n=1 Tax=Polaribacter batillariae TaxID=2808900 RepID=A0ABX7SSU4_9FLAO|nr:DUF5723 family protein [Polaribacter batillariae]QTD36957.1 hypothetical protein JL193_12585 [Polaribacter batillariae]
MKKALLFSSFLLSFFVNSQNKQVLYDFAELPQTLLLNPALETNYKFHVGVPLLSGISSEIGVTNFALSDLFLPDARSINDKVNEVLNRLTFRDYAKVNAQIEVLNAGFRYNDKTYFSFGFYGEIDGIGYIPKDAIRLLNEGNGAFINSSFNASQILYKIDVLGVLHVGITRKIDEKLTIGGRFKIYSSVANVESTNNSGTFTTNRGDNNIYIHYLDDIDVNLRTAGFIKNNEYIDNPREYFKNTFLGGNLGIGLDFGITYNITPQLQFSGSLLDFGFINHKKNIKNTLVKGSFTFEGIDFEFDSNNPRDYWQELNEDFREQLPTIENNDSYISWRPAKLNAALKYSFGEKRSKYCYDNTYKDFYTDAVGAQLYSVFRPLSQQFALTGFYQKSFNKNLHAKVTYTIDDYSAYNIGFGLSAQIWKINFYGIFDNIIQYQDLSSANSASFQLGVNLIFN